MALLERVRTLIRANLNDLIDKAEDPEKMIKQLILDMENQLLQVKTQLAVCIADEHMLAKKREENEDKSAEWMNKAERAVEKGQDDLARAALERHQTYAQLARSFREQVEDQRVQVDNLKSALHRLEQKLSQARSKCDLLIARHRRSRASGKASDAALSLGDGSKAAAFDRMRDRVMREEALSEAKAEVISETLDDRFRSLEQEEQVERLLSEIKARKQLQA
jgi:phage shock protein A